MEEKTEKIKSQVTEVSASKKKIEIEVDAEEAGREFEKILNQYSSRVKLHGFRAGKAPKDMVRRLFSSDIRNAVVDSLAPKALRESLRVHNLTPIGTPVIDGLTFEEGQPFRFKASFDVWPEYDLPGYKKIRVKSRKAEVSEEEVQKSLEELRQKSAEYVPVEGRGVVSGDYVVVELQGKDAKTRRFLPTEKVLILAGHPENEKVLDNNLLGLNPGESREFVISYLKDHQNPKLAGKEIEYRMKGIAIKEKKLPEIGDDFAKEVGEFENLAALKEKVRQELEARKTKAARKEMSDEIIQNISEKLSLEIPESLVELEADAVLRNAFSSAPALSGLKPEDIEDLKARGKKQAEQNLKRHFILRKVAEKEGLAVTDEEVEEEIRSIAKANNVPLAQLVDKLNKEGGRESLKSNLLLQKAVDFLMGNAIIE